MPGSKPSGEVDEIEANVPIEDKMKVHWIRQATAHTPRRGWQETIVGTRLPSRKEIQLGSDTPSPKIGRGGWGVRAFTTR